MVHVCNKEGGTVLAKFMYGSSDKKCSLWNISTRVNFLFQVIDQDDKPVQQSTTNPFELEHEAIIDPSNSILRDRDTLVVEVYQRYHCRVDPFFPQNTFTPILSLPLCFLF